MLKFRSISCIIALAAAAGMGLCSGVAFSQASVYEKAPPEMTALLEATPTPVLELSPAGAPGKRYAAILQPAGQPTIAEMAQPEGRLAGLRFKIGARIPSAFYQVKYLSLTLQALPDGHQTLVSGLPAGGNMIDVVWSPDAKKIALAVASDTGLSLWIVDVATAHARPLPGVKLNGILTGGVFSKPCSWISGSSSLLCLTVPVGQGAPPVHSDLPTGPDTQENLGRATPGRTYEDMLKNSGDEKLFDYYATSQASIVGLNGSLRAVGHPGVLQKAEASPDGQYVLLIERHRPYSYLLPWRNFPVKTSVVNLKTGKEQVLSDKPLADAVPISFDAVEPGPRGYTWRSDKPSTVAWVTAQDDGDPSKPASVRDAVFLLDAPFTGSPKRIAGLPLRAAFDYYSGGLTITWGKADAFLVRQDWYKDRSRYFTLINPTTGETKDLYKGSFEDHYGDPGTPMTTTNAAGKPVLDFTEDGSKIFFTGEGSTPEGDRPFVATFDLSSGKRDIVWRSSVPSYEVPVDRLSDTSFVIRRESPEMSPNYFVGDVGSADWKQLTMYPNPYGTLVLPKKQLLHYKRSDGLELTAELYLPPGYKKSDGPLPTLVHAYPLDFKSRDAASQVTGSPYEFPRYSFIDIPVLFATQGYAVLYNTSLPIVGEGKEQPNDTYVEQLVGGAQAAIAEGARLGVVDPNRVAVIGHSYGAFMTANLLAHTSLFKAGIALSGAYNRTLTPFGFQYEERTYWQDPKLYYDMAPFSFADKIKTPILLFHGEADDNAGTFPVQSERFYSAIKGNGGTVRLVFLPLEAHIYNGKESLETLMAETKAWLDRYVRDTAPAK